MEELENNNNIKIYGFYDPIGLDLENSLLLQVVYLINNKYYVMYQKEDLWSKVIFKLDLIYDMYKDNKEKMYYAISEFMSYFKDIIQQSPEYQFYEIDINKVHNLIPYQEGKVITNRNSLNDKTYNGAVALSNGCIVVGNEEFLENAIMQYVDDIKHRYELLDEVYYNYYDFKKREVLINDFYNLYYNSLDEFERKIWREKQKNNNILLYALSLLKELNVDFQEINNNNLVDTKINL